MIKQYSIGRGDDCQIHIPDQSQKVSRNHATLKIYESGKIFIIDHSSNGTWVNGVKVSQNVEFPIKRGDNISFARAAELNWEQIPRTTNKKMVYVLASLLLIGLITSGYFVTEHLISHEEQKKENVNPLDDIAAKKKMEQEKITKDSIKRADSIRISQKAINKIQQEEPKKTEQKKKTTEIKASENDSVKKEAKKIIYN